MTLGRALTALGSLAVLGIGTGAYFRPRAMKAGLLVCSIAPLADFAIALQRRGVVPQLLIHASGAAGVLCAWAALNAEDA
jgi:4-hydroxybenzoate polyprenyltransferase